MTRVLHGWQEQTAPARTALVMVDLQNDFIDPAGWVAEQQVPGFRGDTGSAAAGDRQLPPYLQEVRKAHLLKHNRLPRPIVFCACQLQAALQVMQRPLWLLMFHEERGRIERSRQRHRCHLLVGAKRQQRVGVCLHHADMAGGRVPLQHGVERVYACAWVV